MPKGILRTAFDTFKQEWKKDCSIRTKKGYLGFCFTAALVGTGLSAFNTTLQESPEFLNKNPQPSSQEIKSFVLQNTSGSLVTGSLGGLLAFHLLFGLTPALRTGACILETRQKKDDPKLQP